MAELLILRNTSFDLVFNADDDDPSGESSSTHLFASLGPWHTAVIRSINGPLTSNAFLMVSVSSNRFTVMPVNGNLPYANEAKTFLRHHHHPFTSQMAHLPHK